MHVLAVNSVSTLLNYLSEQLQNTPSLAEIQGWNKVDEESEENAEEDKNKSKVEEDKVGCRFSSLTDITRFGFLQDEENTQLPPLFTNEMVLEPNQLTFSPDEELFQDGLAEVIKGFQDTVLRVQNLVPDTYFDAFTRYD
jgi:dynein heavy chain